MPFDLYYTSVEGREYKALRSPYPDRESMTGTVASILHDQPDRHYAVEAVITAPLGAVVTHPATGITFRTEKTKESESEGRA